MPFFLEDEDGNLVRPLKYPNGELVHSTGLTPSGVAFVEAKTGGGSFRPVGRRKGATLGNRRWLGR